MSRSAVIVDTPTQGTSDWIVPRRVMCAFFWVGIILLFTGIILLVTSKHKVEAYQSWGAILLGLGFCLLLICFILCMHAYCVITVAEDETGLSQPVTQRQQQKPNDVVRKRAPLKPPPNFKIPSNRQQQNLLDKKINFKPARLKTINENGSPKLGFTRSDSYSSMYGSTSSRADHVRTCVSNITSLPPSGKTLISSTADEEIVHYVASPPSVKISVGKKGTCYSMGSIKDDHNTKLNTNRLNNYNDNNHSGIDPGCSTTGSVGSSPSFDNGSFSNDHTVNLDNDSPTNYDTQGQGISQIVVHNTPVFENYHFNLSLLEQSNPASTRTSEISGAQCVDSEIVRPRTPGYLPNVITEDMDDPPVGSTEYASGPSVDINKQAFADTDWPTGTCLSSSTPKNVRETHIYSRPVASARVTQLPGSRLDAHRNLPNGAPPQLSMGYNRQYPIAAVHAYPIRYKNPHPYSPLRVYVGDTGEEGTEQTRVHDRQVRPLPAIDEQLLDCEDYNHPAPLHNTSSHSSRTKLSSPQQSYQDADTRQHGTGRNPILYQPINLQQRRRMRMELQESANRPFARDNGRHTDEGSQPSNLLSMHGSGLMDRGLNTSANIYLNPDQEFSESKMSIYDNLNYIRI